MQGKKLVRNIKSSRAPQAENELRLIQKIFEQDFHYQIFIARCQDTGEKPDIEKAKMFKESFNKVNSKKHPHVLNLNSMRLGVNTIMRLIGILENHTFHSINLADNSVSEYGMRAVKNLLSSCRFESLNIASNMISEVGLSLVIDELIESNTLKTLDLGISEGSIRKNSLGLDGARCLASILLQNKSLVTLRLEDNDFGVSGAEVISLALKRNKTLKSLKISENLIKTQGAELLLQNALHLSSLDMGKNFIKSSVANSLSKYLQTNANLQKLNLEFNELTAEGAKVLFSGLLSSNVQELNIRGNSIGDRGLMLIADVFIEYGKVHENLKILDISANDFTEQGIGSLLIILQHLELNTLNISRNNLGDYGIINLIHRVKETLVVNSLQKIDVSACKMSDQAFLVLLEFLNEFPELRQIKSTDNYISEKYEKTYADLLSRNKTVISLNLNGNRLSLSGIKGIKKWVDRNLKEFEEKEPKTMKSEIYNIKEKQRKLKEAEEKLKKQKDEIEKLEDAKVRLTENLISIEKDERERKNQFEDTVRKRMQEIEELTTSNSSKIQNLEKLKTEKQGSLDQRNEELLKLKQRRKQLEYQLSTIKNEGQLLEEEFSKKNKLID